MQDRIDVAIRIAYASPRYLKEFGTPSGPEDLDDHRCLTYTRLGGAEWSLKNLETQVVIAVGGAFQTNEIWVNTPPTRRQNNQIGQVDVQLERDRLKWIRTGARCPIAVLALSS